MGNEALDKLSAIVLGKQAAWPETIRIGGSLQKFQCLRNSGALLRIGVRPIKDNQAGFEQAEGSIGRNRQFRLFVILSKKPRSGSSGESVTLFKDYESARKYRPPDRE